jgi:hypothetical protein
VFLKINTVKYDADQEIMNIYKDLQIVRTHFFTDMLLFINIWYNLNILFVYRYSDSLPMNINEVLFGYFQLFIIFGQLFDVQYRR